MPDIKITNGLKKFGKTVAVHDLNLHIKDKDFITLLGPSGCGKTTILRMLAGLESPTEGEIYIDDQCVFSVEKGIDVSPDKRNVGFLFQNYALWPHMTIYDNVAFGPENLKWDKKKIDARVKELLKLLKIDTLADRYPAELSGGQQQRVAIARTMAPNPKVLFMDEPLSNLDAKLRMEMRSELKRLHLETNSTFVYVTHDQLEAMTLSTKICHMSDGQIQQYAPPLEVYNSPKNLNVADFVGNPPMNFVDVVVGATEQNALSLRADGLHFVFTPLNNEVLSVTDGQQIVLGLRPEHVSLNHESDLQGVVYSTLPSGMETIVKVKLHNTLLTSVAFGDVDFEVDETVGISFRSNKYLLFDKETGLRLCSGTLDLII